MQKNLWLSAFHQQNIPPKYASIVQVQITIRPNFTGFLIFRLRSSMVLWRQTVDLTALVWAHELGHALNMSHDFKPNGNKKFDSNSRHRCSDGKGVFIVLLKLPKRFLFTYLKLFWSQVVVLCSVFNILYTQVGRLFYIAVTEPQKR